jgi:protein SMG6
VTTELPAASSLDLDSLWKNYINIAISTPQYTSTPGAETNFEMVKLQEDAILCGFNPWFRGLDWAVYRRYAPRSVPSTLAQDVRRIDAINFCVDYLEGLEPPIMKWSLPDNAHISLASSFAPSKSLPPRSHSMFVESTAADEYHSDEEKRYPSTGNHHVAYGDDQISKLRMRKDELERAEREGRRMRRQVVAEHVSTTLEICPRFVVPDTNCFIDYLSEIRKIAGSGAYGLRVPLVVLNELDGLAKGVALPAASKLKSSNDLKSAADHAVMVTESARRALTFLHSSPPSVVKCVTSKGTTLNSLGITTEDDAVARCDEDKKNDDLILDSCQNLCAFEETTGSEPGGARVVRRDVVLVTEDRNLKLKAHLSDIPVSKMPDFVRWAFPDN